MLNAFSLTKKKSIKQYTPSRDGNVWMHITEPEEKELQMIIKQFALEPGHLKDALDEYEVPRFEEEESCGYFYTRIPSLREGSYTTVPVLFIIHPTALISVSKYDVLVFHKYLTQVLLEEQTPIQLLIQFFNDIVNQYNSAIAKINKKIISTTVNIDRIENRDIVALVLYEQVLNEFLNAVIQTNAFLKVFITNKKFVKKETDQDLVEDLFLATKQLIELSKSSLHQAKNIRDAYSTIMTNNLNRVIKFFTALTIVLTIPMIIASLYGMNVHLPFEQHPYAFLFIITTTFLCSFGVFFIFLKQRWL